ncbi:MAG: TraR/DksA C4-type zinc finger protein [Aeromonas veronii]
MDLIDRANQQTERMLAAQLEQQHRLSLRQPKGESLHQCEECDGHIPEGRRLAMPGVRMCVPCQSVAERRGR